MPPDDLLDEFASTWKEWHYLVGGLAAGIVIGSIGTAAVVWALIRLALAFSPHKAPDRNPDA